VLEKNTKNEGYKAYQTKFEEMIKKQKTNKCSILEYLRSVEKVDSME